MTIIDACFGTVTTVALSNVPVALTATQVQANLLRFTGTLAGNIAVTIPAIIKSWYVENLCVVGASLYVTLGNASGGQIVGLPPGEIVQVVSDGTNIKFISLGRVGTYLDVAATSVPAWITACTVPPYLNCDGTTFSNVTYPFLAAFLGTTTLPDLKGRSRAYLNQGSGRLTTAVGGVDGNTIFAAGGNQGITLDVTQIPSITPTFVGTAMTAGLSALNNVLRAAGVQVQPGASAIAGSDLGSGLRTDLFTPAGNINPFGGGLSHPNVQPIQISGITMIRAA
jgi:microcystin-dependent protein